MSKLELFKATCLARKVVLECEKNRYNYLLKEKENNIKQELYTWLLASSNFALVSININSKFFIKNEINYKPLFLVGTGLCFIIASLTSKECHKKDKKLTKKIINAKKDYDKAKEQYNELEYIEI